MAIFDTSSILILVSIIFLSITPSSIGHKVTDTEIKHLCSKTNNHEDCYKLLKSDHRTTNVDARGLAEVSVDLASNKASKIHSQLNSFAKGTHKSQLRNIYNLCSKNYNDVIRDLKVVKNNLLSGAYKNIPIQVTDATEEIKSCKQVFDAAPSDYMHMKTKNKDVEFLLSIVKVTSDNLNQK